MIVVHLLGEDQAIILILPEFASITFVVHLHVEIVPSNVC